MRILPFVWPRIFLCSLFIGFLLSSAAVIAQTEQPVLAQTGAGHQQNTANVKNGQPLANTANDEASSDRQTILILAIIFIVICVVIFLVLREESHTC